MNWRDDIGNAPEGVVVNTKIDDEHGERNFETLKKVTREPGKTRPMWFLPDGSSYVYYAPTHWCEVEQDEAKYLIRKRGTYYRPNIQGYTGSAIIAGRYTLEEAVSITHPNGKDGPRDGMTYIHEDELDDEEWLAYAALRDGKA